MKCQVNYSITVDGVPSYWISKYNEDGPKGWYEDAVYENGSDLTKWADFVGSMSECKGYIRKKRNQVSQKLHCVLYLADADVIPQDLILFLDDNVNRDGGINKHTLMSKCFLFWGSDKLDDKKVGVQSELIRCLDKVKAWSPSVQRKKAKDQALIMRGWRISRSKKS